MKLSTLNLWGENHRVICDRARTKALRRKHSRRRTQSRRVQELQPEWYARSISYEPWPELLRKIADPMRGEPRIDATVERDPVTMEQCASTTGRRQVRSSQTL